MNENECDTFYCDDKNRAYAYYCLHAWMYAPNNGDTNNSFKSIKPKKGDTITFELNMKYGNISIYINNKCQGIAINTIERNKYIKYRFAVTMWEIGNKIELINFEVE